jgi:predicted ATPase with chaperone activity
VSPAPRRSAEAIDLLDVAGASVAKRLAPVAAVVALLLLLFWRRRHRD